MSKLFLWFCSALLKSFIRLFIAIFSEWWYWSNCEYRRCAECHFNRDCRLHEFCSADKVPDYPAMLTTNKIPNINKSSSARDKVLFWLQFGFKSFHRFVSLLIDSGLSVVSTGSACKYFSFMMIKVYKNYFLVREWWLLYFKGTVGTARFAMGTNAAKRNLLCRAKKSWGWISCSRRQSVAQWG